MGNTRDLGNCHAVNADLFHAPFPDNSFDFVIADGVLHHTPSTRGAMEALYRKVKPGGQFFFYVYRKMGAARAFVDAHIREAFMKLEPEACYAACEGITELGRELSRLKATVTLEKPIDVLGIPAGTHDVQRLIYYNFMKCFWNEAFDYETNNMVNFDWYHPHHAWQQTDEDVIGWLTDLGVTEYALNDSNPNGISVLLRKPLELARRDAAARKGPAMASRILLTGASGFVGQALVRELSAEGHSIVCLGRKAPALPGVAAATADISDPASFRAALAALRKEPRFDAIIHLAVSRHHREFPQKALDLFYVNSASAAELLDFARDTGVPKAVFGSTGTVYSTITASTDENASGNQESEFREPAHYFAASKLFADALCGFYRGFLKIATLRLYAPYGPGLEDRMLTDLVARVESGRPLSLPASGPGLAFSSIYIDDAMAVIRRALADGWNETVNAAGPEVFTIESIGQLIGAIVGREPTFLRGAQGYAPRIVPDTTRLSQLMPGHAFHRHGGRAPRDDRRAWLSRASHRVHLVSGFAVHGMNMLSGRMFNVELPFKPSAPHGSDIERRHIAALLASVEKEAHISQRRLASELGVALGLVNSYIRRCARKGLIKIQQAPRRRYAYYLTPQGFAEKSRLTAEYLSWSFTFFRHARVECGEVLDAARRRGWRTLALFVGAGELAEIMILTASERGVTIGAVVDAVAKPPVLATPVFAAAADVTPPPDGWIVTAITGAQAAFDDLAAVVGPDRILHPPMLGVSASAPRLADL